MSRAKDWLTGHRRSAVVTVLVAAALVTGAVLWVRAHANKPEPVREEKQYTVRVIETAPTGKDVTAKYTGLVQPAEIIQCTPDTIGTIQTLYVKEGDTVTEGQPLALLDPASVDMQSENFASVVKSAKAGLDAAVSAQERAQDDYDRAVKGPVSAELEKARAERDAARGELDQQQKELDRIDGLLAPQQEKVDAARTAYEKALTAKNDAAAQHEAASARRAGAEEALHSLEADPESTEEALTAARAELEAAEQAERAACAARDQAVRAEADAAAEKAAQEAELAAQQVSLGRAGAAAAVEAARIQLDAKQGAVDLLKKGQGEESPLARAQKERLEAAKAAVAQAQNLYDMAVMNRDNLENSTKDPVLRAPASGQVVKLVGMEGGLASPLAPVVVLAGEGSAIEFGASQSDVRSLYEGMDAAVTLDGKTYYGHVTSIALLPDEATRTYPIRVEVEQHGDELFLGSMAAVELSMGERTGVWLPLSVILNDGQDYVYIVKDGHALRRDVSLSEVSNDMVLVTGLEEGCQIISEGMKMVRSGSAVKIVGESGGEAA